LSVDIVTRYVEKAKRLVVGLMSGTSADGVNAAAVEIRGRGDDIEVELVRFRKVPYPSDLRQAIFRLFSPECPVVEVARMNFVLGEFFADAALEIIRATERERGKVDLIASHGQTVCHLPRPQDVALAMRTASTLQIGEPCVIAERTGITTVADFRPRDIAAGGQGAPLVAIADHILFHDREKGRLIQNIGGIANVTVLPPGRRLEDVFAFDTGPGNMVIDAVVDTLTKGLLPYDKDGEVASQGLVDDSLLEWMMGHEFIGAVPPKTTGREEFGHDFASELFRRGAHLPASDLVATATAFTAESIAHNYRHFVLQRCPVEEVILGGGGSYNPAIRRMLKQRLPDLAFFLHEDMGILGDAKEALAFAILGDRTMQGLAGNVPAATGAAMPVVLGKIIPGRASPL
jgi:anhydro-N-acetylmuramic acid kinase